MYKNEIVYYMLGQNMNTISLVGWNIQVTKWSRSLISKLIYMANNLIYKEIGFSLCYKRNYL